MFIPMLQPSKIMFAGSGSATYVKQIKIGMKKRQLGDFLTKKPSRDC